jgi:hypothetical protein
MFILHYMKEMDDDFITNYMRIDLNPIYQCFNHDQNIISFMVLNPMVIHIYHKNIIQFLFSFSLIYSYHRLQYNHFI